MLQGFRQLCLALRGIGWNLGKQNVDPLATRIFLHTQAESTILRPARGHAFPFLMGFVRCALWQLGLAGGAELLYPDLLGIRELFYFLKRRSKLKGRAVAVNLAQQPLLCLLLRRKRRSRLRYACGKRTERSKRIRHSDDERSCRRGCGTKFSLCTASSVKYIAKYIGYAAISSGSRKDQAVCPCT